MGSLMKEGREKLFNTSDQYKCQNFNNSENSEEVQDRTENYRNKKCKTGKLQFKVTKKKKN